AALGVRDPGGARWPWGCERWTVGARHWASGGRGCARVRGARWAPESWKWSRRGGFLRVVLPASVQCRKGISYVSVRLRPLFATLLAISSLALSCCCNNPARVTGNERLIRGAGGLGSPLVETTIPDRDTY